MFTSMPPVDFRLLSELSSWYCHRAPAGGSHGCAGAAAAPPPAARASIARTAAIRIAYFCFGAVPTTSQMM
jgi:hypothetical protein